MLDRYSQQVVNETAHQSEDKAGLLKECFKNWEQNVLDIQEAVEIELEEMINEETIINAYLALIAGLTSNINTSIVMFSKHEEEKLGSYEAILKASKIVPIVANYGFWLEASGDEEIQRVTVNTGMRFKELLANKAIKFPMTIIPREVYENNENGWVSGGSLLIGKAKKHKEYLNYGAINTISGVPLKVRQNLMLDELNEKVVVPRKNKQGFKKDYTDYKLELETAKLVRSRTIEFIKQVGGSEFYHNYGYDGRGRMYVNPTILNYQQDSKHLIKLANEEKLTDIGYDNLLIDLANQYGDITLDDKEHMINHWFQNKEAYPSIKSIKDIDGASSGDKGTWDIRVLFGDTFFSGKFSNTRYSKALHATNEPKLFLNSKDAFKDWLADKPTGHLIGLDATTSVKC